MTFAIEKLRDLGFQDDKDQGQLDPHEGRPSHQERSTSASFGDEKRPACNHDDSPYLLVSGTLNGSAIGLDEDTLFHLSEGVHAVVNASKWSWPLRSKGPSGDRAPTPPGPKRPYTTPPITPGSDFSYSYRAEDEGGEWIGGKDVDDVGGLRGWVVGKSVNSNENTRMKPHDVRREARILGALSHPNIIPLLNAYYFPYESTFTLYLPLLPLPLSTLLNSPFFSPHLPPTPTIRGLPDPLAFATENSDFSRNDAFGVLATSLIWQIVLGVEYLERKGVAHRDLKPANIVIGPGGEVRLIDFGTAWEKDRDSTRLLAGEDDSETDDKMVCDVGTGSYRAPELLFSPPSYSPEAIDRWSLGVLLSEFFTPLIFSCSEGGQSPTPSFTSSLIDDDALSPTSSSTHARKGWKEPFETGGYGENGGDRGGSRGSYFETKTWERRKLFEGERGDVGLAGSIFSIRGSPGKESWPDFDNLPDAHKIPFPATPSAIPLHLLLPNLPRPSLLPSSASSSSTDLLLPQAHPLLIARTITPRSANPTLPSLLSSLLALSPERRSSAARIARHPYFCAQTGGVLLPRGRTDPGIEGVRGVWSWKGKGLRELVEGWVAGCVEEFDGDL
ncbi:kinase-like domain-containing protein [Mrakia frigida]|uniref:kinase-like domain-containing protein n=1 Tax=Mrakia frigida TaxID=29902 RepID=UPI003FCC0FC9